MYRHAHSSGIEIKGIKLLQTINESESMTSFIAIGDIIKMCTIRKHHGELVRALHSFDRRLALGNRNRVWDTFWHSVVDHIVSEAKLEGIEISPPMRSETQAVA